MKSTYELIWTEEALEGLREIISYLEHKFSEKDTRKFVKKFDAQLKIIQSNPFAFPISNKSKTTRRTIVAKLTSIYYFIEDETIILVSVFDNRKKPII
ncbi:MAG: type II toxin-antitoxin system RelE/ParE family toxin [Saprospiraceae bacterium]|nr:type II toxin-antitoxin system RelE/ParE family toxin [Saprospiraceae bacterium]